MAWLYLAIAGALEVSFTTALKYAEGFCRLWPSLIFVAAYAGSAWFLSLAIKSIPIGTAYAAWTGIGAVGTVLLGVLLFGEPVVTWRLIFLALIVVGLIGLKAVSA